MRSNDRKILIGKLGKPHGVKGYLYLHYYGDDLSVFDKIIQTDGINAEQVLEIAKTTVRELL